jgi:hypothetical protein
MFDKVTNLRQLLSDRSSLTPYNVSVCLSKAEENDVFYRQLAEAFYQTTRRRHPFWLFMRKMEYDCAIMKLHASWDQYFAGIEASARRNYKKAQRCGYTFKKLDYNKHLDDIKSIRRSAEVRQGPMPKSYLEGEVSAVTDPPSRSHYHDYVYYGVFSTEKLVAYAGLFVCGEVAMIQHILGHADHQANGVVPYLIINQAKMILMNYPQVRFYMYGSWYGATETLKRFKKRFLFMPAHVTWSR